MAAPRHISPEPLEQVLYRLARQVDTQCTRRPYREGTTNLWIYETISPVVHIAVPHQRPDAAAWAALLGLRYAHDQLSPAYAEGELAEHLLDDLVNRRWAWAVGRVAGWPGRWVCRVRRDVPLEHTAGSKAGAILGVLEVLWGEAGWWRRV